MKTDRFQKVMVAVAIGSMALLASNALAQDSTATVQPAAASAAPQLGYGMAEVLHLSQAKVSDDTIIAYIRNSGTSYNLNADQIIYLRQQGVSTAVLNLMLTQPKTADTTATASTAPAPQPAPQPAVSTATVAPTVTYVQTVPTTTYYYSNPYYYPAYYGGYYGGVYPSVSLSFGWGGRWGGGGGGWHGGGGHGGWHH